MFKILVFCTVLSVGYTAPRMLVKFSPEVVALAQTAASQCSTTQYTAATLFKIIKEGEFKEDDSFQKIVHCAYQVLGIGNEDGTINVRKASSMFPDPSAIVSVIEECSKNVGNPVENSYHFFKCYQINSPLLIDLQM